MKKIYLSTIIIGVAVLVSACSIVPKTLENNLVKGVETVDQNLSEYKNTVDRLSFNYPKNWELEENKFGFTVIVFTPKDDEINENVGIAFKELPKFLSVQEYYEEAIFELESTLPDFKEIQTKDIQKNELNGKSIIYTHIGGDKGEVKIKSQQTFLISGENIVYIINYTATQDTFDKYIKDVEKITESFVVLQY